MAEIPKFRANPLVIARATHVGQGPFDAAPDPFESELPHLNRECDPVKPCWTVGCEGPRALVDWTPGYQIVCEGCGSEGEWKETPADAVVWWNGHMPHGKPEPAPAAEPVTDPDGARLPACPVPGCGGGAGEMYRVHPDLGPHFQVRCERCDTRGPVAGSAAEAESGWGMLCELTAKGGAVPILSEAERARWCAPGGTRGRLHRPITEDWLRANGFAVESGRAGRRLPVRSPAVASEKRSGLELFESSDDLCVDVAPGSVPGRWLVWVAQREPRRHIFVRPVSETWEVAALYSGLTGNLWPGTL